ncbi:MAG: MOSC domain-containing protein [Pseudomonadota bacterium]
MQLRQIYRHPVKSLGTEALETVPLAPGQPMPGDRRYAIAHADSAFNADAPAWVSCRNFLRVANVPALSAVRLGFDPESETLRVDHDAAEPCEADLSTATGQADLLAWVAHFAEPVVPGPYRLAAVPGQSLTDSDQQVPSLMSLSSLRALSARVGAELDPRRFRGNFWIDGDGPWAEMDWVGKEISLGSVRFKVLNPIERCLATAANPKTGRRDNDPLPALRTLFGDPLFGMEIEIISGGPVQVGDTVTVL